MLRMIIMMTTTVTMLMMMGRMVASASDVPKEVTVTLSRVSTLYIPTYTGDGSSTYAFFSSTVEQLAIDFTSKLIYGVGKGVIHVIDASDVSNLTLKDHMTLADLDLTDVEVCGEAVFISYTNESDPLQGGMFVYRTYDAESGELALLQNIPLGSLPDQMKLTPNCTVVVALENEAFWQGGQFYDPPGGVGIVRFPSGIAAEPEVKVLNFTQFDDQFEQLSESGVRWVYRDRGSNFSDNAEPEYVAFNDDYSKAYVCLQENNAIAVVDMTTDSITGIHGLGFKSWGDLDPSDSDGGIHIAQWPVKGMFQPDSIEWVHWNDQGYLITANEGDAQEYYNGSVLMFSEETRGKDIEESEIAASVSDDLKQALRNDSQLGRLKLSYVDGKNSDGKFEHFYAYGARGISIWRASDMVRVFDSGSDMEREHAQRRPDIFNSNTNPDQLLSETVDTRSDDKGPETESLAVGVEAGHLLIFAGNERPGSIAVYTAAPGSMLPRFQTLVAPPGSENRTWQQLYDDRLIYAVDPEFLQYIPVSKGLANYPVLLVGSSVSGTVSMFRVDVQSADDPTGTANPGTSCCYVMVALCGLLVSLKAATF